MFSRLSDNQDMRVFADILTRGVSVFLLSLNYRKCIITNMSRGGYHTLRDR